jgi:hypothetical protein
VNAGMTSQKKGFPRSDRVILKIEYIQLLKLINGRGGEKIGVQAGLELLLGRI